MQVNHHNHHHQFLFNGDASRLSKLHSRVTVK